MSSELVSRGETLRVMLVTDTHIDIKHDGRWNQPVWIGAEKTLFQRLEDAIRTLSVDLLIHCGDVTDGGRSESILRAFAFLEALPCPVAAVRGNHDLLSLVQYDDWRDARAKSQNVVFGDTVLTHPLCDFFFLNNQWLSANGTPNWNWRTSPVGWISDEQLDWLDNELLKMPSRPGVLVMHYPSDIIPPYPVPEQLQPKILEHSARMEKLLAKHPRVKLVAAGHFHRTQARISGCRIHMTTAAFSEAPFQVRYLEIAKDLLSVQTFHLSEPGDEVTAIENRAWINGQNTDLCFQIPL